VSCPVFVVTGEDETTMAQAAAGFRKQIAFYGSTPAYRGVLDLHGWSDLHTELHRLSKLGQWDAMGELVDDDVLSTFAVVAPLSEVAQALVVRCAGAIDRVLPAFPASLPEDAVTAVLDDVRSASNDLRDKTVHG
jgi:hypothetical protein